MRYRVSGLLGAILLSLTASAAAIAGPPSNDGGMWYYWLACPPGTASTGTISEIWTENNKLFLSYTTTPCTTPSSTTAMAVGFYYPDGHSDGRAYPYAPDRWHHISVPPGALATCLLAMPQIRLDCYELVWDYGLVTAGQRLSPADPRVAAAAPEIQLYLVPPNSDDPYCPLCTP